MTSDYGITLINAILYEYRTVVWSFENNVMAVTVKVFQKRTVQASDEVRKIEEILTIFR